MKKNITITVPKLTTAGGVSSFWNALLPELYSYEDVHLKIVEIGGHGKNVFGLIRDQIVFRKTNAKSTHLVVLNPSLGSRSFFRDGLFASHLVKKNIPFIVFFHGWDLDFEAKVSQKHVSFFQRSFGRATKIFVLSNDFKLTLRTWGFKGDVVVETTTVDKNLIKEFSLEQKQASLQKNTTLKILFLSRLIKEKGIYELVNAFKNLRAKFSHVELIVAGDGSDYSAVADYVENEAGITLTGHVVGKEKINLFKECQIYCLPSYSEGLPTSVLEAMAFGLPVITTSVGGLKDFFQDEKMGYSVDLSVKDQLEEKLNLLISNEPLRVQMAKYNHTYAMKNLLSDVLAKRLCDYFLESINSNEENKSN